MGHEEFSDGIAKEFNQALEGRWNPRVGQEAYDNIGDAFTAGYLRMAGGIELPGELNVLRNLLLKGQLKDDTGEVTFTRDGSIGFRPSDSNWELRASLGHDPSVMVNYRSTIPEGPNTPPGQSVDNALANLEAVQGNKDWADERYNGLSPSGVAALQMGVKDGRATMVPRDLERYPVKGVIRNEIPYLGPSPWGS